MITVHRPDPTAPMSRWAISPVLPSPETLLCAIRGQVDEVGSPIIDGARQLGSLYRELIADPLAGVPIRAQIGAVVGGIDSWVHGQLPPPHPGAVRVMDSVGGAISRLAEASEAAIWALQHYPPADLRVHQVWEHLAEMREGYAEFTEKVLAGAFELPKSWPGIESMEQDLTE